jgi:hypothetical protein
LGEKEVEDASLFSAGSIVREKWKAICGLSTKVGLHHSKVITVASQQNYSSDVIL